MASSSSVSSSPYLIELKDVEKVFHDTGSKTLSGINLKLNSGEFVFLTGASGSGKTTLLRMIMGLSKPTKGELFVLGKAVNRLSDSARRELRRNLGIILQDHKLLGSLNVSENVELPLIWRGIHSPIRRKRLAEILEVMDLSHIAFSSVATLSGGEKQRVAIARALVTAPQLILADEPTGNLDPPTSRQLVRMLRELRIRGSTVLFATHDMTLVRDFGGRVLELVSGRIPADSMPSADIRFKVPEFWSSP
jgi:cell division transport system ATP-binding protein